ncbi:MAG: Jag N-terminal domain-containing protein [Campylobacterota bacterium]
MLKVEAPSLEEAYSQASSKLECSITELHFEIIQHPKPGFLGLFKKSAVIVATCKEVPQRPRPKPKERKHPAPAQPSSKQTQPPKEKSPRAKEPQQRVKSYNTDEDEIIQNFYTGGCDENDGVCKEIDEKINALFETMCFDLERIYVSMIDDDTVFIEIKGDDAALLIGKEGYRYKALSYMLFNWINSKYNLSLRLEVAEFLTSQEKMIANYIKPVITQIKQSGRGQTKPLDGILVQIALKQLRSQFPNKYVGIKTNSFDEKYIVVNDFRK